MKLPNGQHLAYCTNVHPYDSLEGMLAALAGPTSSLRQRLVTAGALGAGDALGVGLWMPAAVARAVAADPAPLRDRLAELDLYAFTVNAFPYGDFHGAVVKDKVFQPTWAETRRVEYTLAAAEALAAVLPDGLEGSVSTHTGGYKPWGPERNDREAVAAGFLRAARGLADLEARTGRRIVLAMEPEPFSLLETMDEVVAFFDEFVPEGGGGARRYLGVCFDACHQAVEYESMGQALEALAGAGIPIGKIQLSSAIRLPDPAADRERLAPFAEDRWFHQVLARTASGELRRWPDLGPALADPEAATAAEWRVHYHVPVFASDLDAQGRLSTTRDDLQDLLHRAADTAVTPHLEIETYSFDMIPEERRAALGAVDLVDALEKEFAWVLQEHPAVEAEG